MNVVFFFTFQCCVFYSKHIDGHELYKSGRWQSSIAQQSLELFQHLSTAFWEVLPPNKQDSL